jgi:hypothetical protein
MTDADRATTDCNPLLLTMEGEFVVKNRVVLTGALTIAGRTPRGRRPGLDSACEESNDG